MKDNLGGEYVWGNYIPYVKDVNGNIQWKEVPEFDKIAEREIV